jgi:radical SAM protein with 4Fe4S-binding SPASM domain
MKNIFDMKSSHVFREERCNTGIDIFGELEISLSRTCDKQCISCPHSVPNYRVFNKMEHQYMDMGIVDIIVAELREIDFSGQIDIAGLGEPVLHPDFLEIFDKLIHINNKVRVRLVTNGYKKKFKSVKFLNEIKSLLNNRTEILFSVYNKNDMDFYNNICEQLSSDLVCIKEIFLENYSLEKSIIDFNLNNRGGSVSSVVNLNRNDTCYYPFFMLFISPNGDYQYCPHDWQKKLIIGNIMDIGLLDMWKTKTRQRELFLNHRRNDIKVCKECNVDGTLIGGLSFDTFGEV